MFGFPGVMDIICEYKVGADSKRARAVESMCDLMAEARGCNTIVKLQEVTLRTYCFYNESECPSIETLPQPLPSS